MPLQQTDGQVAASVNIRAERAVRWLYKHEIHKRTDRLFAGLMVLQWIGGILFALWISPLAWSGTTSSTHIHVWAAVILGGLISLFPALLGLFRPGLPSTRYTIAAAQMLMGALLIHLTGGRIETHFHVFGSLAFLAFYRDWRVLVPATVVVALDHILRGYFWPQSVYGVLVASQWRWLEHAAWVIFEDVFLVVACLRSMVELRETADRTAALEQEVRTRQQAEMDARNSEARSDAILSVALDCVILMDESGRIVQFNPAAERTFGYAASEAVGHQLADLMIPADQREAYQEALPRYLKSGQATAMNRRFELSAVRKGGEIFPVEVAIAPISSDGIGDVRRLHARHYRAPPQRSRAGRLHARTWKWRTKRSGRTASSSPRWLTSFASRNGGPKTRRRAKSDFLASMSHELRTPLERHHSLQRAPSGDSRR